MAATICPCRRVTADSSRRLAARAMRRGGAAEWRRSPIAGFEQIVDTNDVTVTRSRLPPDALESRSASLERRDLDHVSVAHPQREESCDFPRDVVRGVWAARGSFGADDAIDPIEIASCIAKVLIRERAQSALACELRDASRQRGDARCECRRQRRFCAHGGVSAGERNPGVRARCCVALFGSRVRLCERGQARVDALPDGADRILAGAACQRRRVAARERTEKRCADRRPVSRRNGFHVEKHRPSSKRARRCDDPPAVEASVAGIHLLERCIDAMRRRDHGRA